MKRMITDVDTTERGADPLEMRCRLHRQGRGQDDKVSETHVAFLTSVYVRSVFNERLDERWTVKLVSLFMEISSSSLSARNNIWREVVRLGLMRR